jgi:hypothetical protein
MKSILNKTVLVAGVLIVTIANLNGCSNDNTATANYQVKAQIYMPGAQNNPVQVSLNDTLHEQTKEYNAIYVGPNKLNNDIQINFNVDSSFVSKYNSKNLTSYSILPKTNYKLSKSKATIFAGRRSTPVLKAIFNNNNLPLDKKFLLPVSLATTNNEITVNKRLRTIYYLVNNKQLVRNIFYYDRSDWKVIDSDSHYSVYTASTVVDGNPNTFWNTQLHPPAPFPHYVIIDMGKVNSIEGFRFIGRPAGTYAYLNLKNIEIQFSDNGHTWKEGKKFTLPLTLQDVEAKVNLSHAVKARYFKIIITSNVGNKSSLTCLAEVYAFKYTFQ